MLGYGIWWAIVEDLYSNDNNILTDYETIAFDLRCDVVIIKSILHDFDLFIFNETHFGSLSVGNRIDIMHEKSKQASISANIRWEKERDKKKRGELKKPPKQKPEPNPPTEEKPLSAEQKDFQTAFSGWIEMRKQIKKPATERAQELAKSELRKLAGKDISLAIQIINQSVVCCWTSFYPLKENNNNNGYNNAPAKIYKDLTNN